MIATVEASGIATLKKKNKNKNNTNMDNDDFAIQQQNKTTNLRKLYPSKLKNTIIVNQCNVRVDWAGLRKIEQRYFVFVFFFK